MEFRVFTLNCWGIPIASKNRKDRIRAIATALANSTYDVVCLQEVWADSDYFSIRNKVKGSLPYSHYYYSGYTGSGVCIFSRHKILQVHFHKWMINGYVHKVHHGDWFGGKGVAMCVLKWNGLKINVYSSHLHAEYNRKKDEYYPCRVVQAYETAQFIQLTSGNADVIILAGDLNTEPGDLPYRLMVNIPGFKDAFFENASDDQVSTVYSLKNSYTPHKLIKKQTVGPRIDYILTRGSARVSVKQSKYSLPLPNKVPEKQFSYSDHEAVTATLICSEVPNTHESNTNDQKQDINEAIDVLKKGIKSTKRHKIFYWFCTIFLSVIIMCTFAIDEYGVVLDIFRLFLTIIMCYMFTMAFIWSRLEINAMHSSKLSMEVYVNGLS